MIQAAHFGQRQRGKEMTMKRWTIERWSQTHNRWLYAGYGVNRKDGEQLLRAYAEPGLHRFRLLNPGGNVVLHAGTNKDTDHE